MGNASDWEKMSSSSIDSQEGYRTLHRDPKTGKTIERITFPSPKRSTWTQSEDEVQNDVTIGDPNMSTDEPLDLSSKGSTSGEDLTHRNQDIGPELEQEGHYLIRSHEIKENARKWYDFGTPRFEANHGRRDASLALEGQYRSTGRMPESRDLEAAVLGISGLIVADSGEGPQDAGDHPVYEENDQYGWGEHDGPTPPEAEVLMPLYELRASDPNFLFPSKEGREGLRDYYAKYELWPNTVILSACNACSRHEGNINLLAEDPRPISKRIRAYREHPCTHWNCVERTSQVCNKKRTWLDVQRICQEDQGVNELTKVRIDKEYLSVAWDLNDVVKDWAHSLNSADSDRPLETALKDRCREMVDRFSDYTRTGLPVQRLFAIGASNWESRDPTPINNPCNAMLFPRMARILTSEGTYNLLNELVEMKEIAYREGRPMGNPFSLGTDLEGILAPLQMNQFRDLEAAEVFEFKARVKDRRMFNDLEIEDGIIMMVIIDYAAPRFGCRRRRLYVMSPLASFMTEKSLPQRLGAFRFLIRNKFAADDGERVSMTWGHEMYDQCSIKKWYVARDGDTTKPLPAGADYNITLVDYREDENQRLSNQTKRAASQFLWKLSIDSAIGILCFDILIRDGSRHRLAKLLKDPHIFNNSKVRRLFELIRAYRFDLNDEKEFKERQTRIIVPRIMGLVRDRVQIALIARIRDICLCMWDLMMSLDTESFDALMARTTDCSLLDWMKVAFRTLNIPYDDNDLELIRQVGQVAHGRNPDRSAHDSVIGPNYEVQDANQLPEWYKRYMPRARQQPYEDWAAGDD